MFKILFLTVSYSNQESSSQNIYCSGICWQIILHRKCHGFELISSAAIDTSTSALMTEVISLLPFTLRAGIAFNA